METNDPHIGPIESGVPPRHSIPTPPLITPTGDPIPPTTSPDPLINPIAGDKHLDPPLHQRMTDTEKSVTDVGTGVLITGAIAVLALILVLVTGSLYLAQRSTINDLQSQQTANSTEAARKDATQRQATCQLVVALRGTASTAARNAWPTGTNGYDAFQSQIALSSTTLNCDAG